MELYLSVVFAAIVALVKSAPITSGQGWLLPVSCYDASGNAVECQDVPVLELLPAYRTSNKLQGDFTTSGDPDTVWRYYDDLPGNKLPGTVVPYGAPGTESPGEYPERTDVNENIIPFGIPGIGFPGAGSPGMTGNDLTGRILRRKRSVAAEGTDNPQRYAAKNSRCWRDPLSGRLICAGRK